MMLSTNRSRALTWAILLGLGLTALADEKPCTLHDDGKYYDLNPLKASKDYVFKTPGGHSFYLNVCRPVTTDPWTPGVPDGVDIAGLVRKDHHDFAIGLVNTTLEMKDAGLMLHLSNGSPCPGADNLYGSSAIMFLCDTSVYGAGIPTIISQWPEDDEHACQYTVEWRTHFACPAGERGIFSGILVFLVITLMILLTLFIVASILYSRFVLRKRGFEQLTQLSKANFVELIAVCVDVFQSLMDNIRSNILKSRTLNTASHHWSSQDEEQAMMADDPLEGHTGRDRELQDTDVWRSAAADRVRNADDFGTIRS